MLVGDLESDFAEEIALRLRSSKKTTFVTGAGISCNAGIPDFRSEDGLYNLVKQKFPDTFVKGKDLFDSILFRDARSIEIFYSFISELRQATLEAKPTPTHHFLHLLKDKKKLLRVYTQNIDGLEFKVGLGQSDVVQLHGDIHRLKCMQCMTPFDWNGELAAEMLQGGAPDCTNCASASLARHLSGKRSTAIGQLRPDIVLYGEDHPAGDEIATILKRDCAKKNLGMLVVTGTSLKVHGLKRLVKALAQATHAAGGVVVLVNKSNVSLSEWDPVFDYHLRTDVDMWIQDLKMRIPTFFERQSRIKLERKRKSDGIVVAKRSKSETSVEKVSQRLPNTPESIKIEDISSKDGSLTRSASPASHVSDGYSCSSPANTPKLEFADPGDIEALDLVHDKPPLARFEPSFQDLQLAGYSAGDGDPVPVPIQSSLENSQQNKA